MLKRKKRLSKKKLEKVMVSLAKCKLSPEEWSSWWSEHELEIKRILTDDEFGYLEYRSYNGISPWLGMLCSRSGAIRYLKKHRFFTPYQLETPEEYRKRGKPNLYHENYEKERIEATEKFEKKMLEAKKEYISEFKATYPQFCEKYPNFVNSLTLIDVPHDIKAFFEMVSYLYVYGYGFTLDFSIFKKII